MAVIVREGVYKDLMEIGWFKRLMKWRGLQFTLQFIGLTVFSIVVYAGLFGTPVGRDNLGSIFTWLIWWSLIPVTMLVAGRIWCLVCPFVAPGEWLQRLALWWKGKRTLSLNLKMPKFLKNFGLMLVLFLILHWADSNFHLAYRPITTAYLALGLLIMATVITLIFEKRSFCRYFCPIGAIIAPYSLVAPVELRNRDNEVCRHCKTRDCIKGSEKGYACPQMIYPYAIDRNTHCLMCTECAKTCPHDNVAINIRRPFQDIFKEGLGFRRTRDITLSLSIIVIVLLGIIPFHNLEMTKAYSGLEGSLANGLGISPMIIRTTAFLTMGAIFVAIFWCFSSLAQRIAGNGQYNTKYIFIWFSLVFIPLAISLHLAHNYFHLLREGAVIVPNLSDPFGFGWNLFGTKGTTAAILSSGLIGVFQFLTLYLGFFASGYVLYRLAFTMFKEPIQAFRVMFPFVMLLVGLVAFYMWVLTIPMTMRM